MTLLDLTILLQIIMLGIGSILMFFAGNQDEKTRKPFLLIPALMAISLSAGLTTFLIVTLSCITIFFLPAKVNKIIGKADLLLLSSILTIFILNQNILLTIMLYVSLGLTTLYLFLNVSKEKKPIPFIQYYTKAYALAIIIMTLAIIIATIRSLI